LIAEQKRVIICPLDWGFGHASRMIPLINLFIDRKYKVIIGGSGKSAALLRSSFPDLQYIFIASPVIRYAKHSLFLVSKLIAKLPVLIFFSVREHFLIKKICTQHHISLVVSDNRYGLFCSNAYCIFVTHQLSPVMPKTLRWAGYVINRIINLIIKQYDECWIPDYPGKYSNLSGLLTRKYSIPSNACFIGILSRFPINIAENTTSSNDKQYDVVILASGPEPQLTVFNEMIIRQASVTTYNVLLIAGYIDDTSKQQTRKYNSLTIVPHLHHHEFQYVLIHAKIIICRAGYSTIMDIIALGKTAILIPTPKQSEQEYLAEYLTQQGLFTSVRQQDFQLERIIQQHIDLNRRTH
jgi:uncharacterized protein (TIGR00661 family)